VLDYLPQIERILDKLLGSVTTCDSLDIANDVAHPLAMSVVCTIGGIPSGEMDMLLRNSNYISGLLEMGEPEQLYRCQQGMLELHDYLRPVIADHQAHPRDDLIGALLSPQAEGLHYTREEVISQCIMFLVVGYHTTANLLCNGLQLLFEHPKQREKLDR